MTPDVDTELEAMKKRVVEMEQEAAKLRQMQEQVEKEMNLTEDQKNEVDARSVYVGNVGVLLPEIHAKLSFFPIRTLLYINRSTTRLHQRRFKLISRAAEQSIVSRFSVISGPVIPKATLMSNSLILNLSRMQFFWMIPSWKEDKSRSPRNEQTSRPLCAAVSEEDVPEEGVEEEVEEEADVHIIRLIRLQSISVLVYSVL